MVLAIVATCQHAGPPSREYLDSGHLSLLAPSFYIHCSPSTNLTKKTLNLHFNLHSTLVQPYCFFCSSCPVRHTTKLARPNRTDILSSNRADTHLSRVDTHLLSRADTHLLSRYALASFIPSFVFSLLVQLSSSFSNNFRSKCNTSKHHLLRQRGRTVMVDLSLDCMSLLLSFTVY